MLYLSTGRWIENRWGFRFSFHVFLWGLHWKLRLPNGVWRHLVVKAYTEHTLRRAGMRYALWVGWWKSRKGNRGGVSGLRFAVDRVSALKPGTTQPLPFYPRPRKHREAA